MTIVRADSKRRVVLPSAEAGDVFDVEDRGGGRLLLVRLQKPKAGTEHPSREECLRRVRISPLTPTMPWEELRKLTREP